MFCGNCGKELGDGDVVCQNCGTINKEDNNVGASKIEPNDSNVANSTFTSETNVSGHVMMSEEEIRNKY